MSELTVTATLRPYRDEKHDFEVEYCRRALRLAGGNVALAARFAMMDRRSFYELMYRCGERQRAEDPAA